ncbi:MAG TPA: FAD-dependent oxidoreductase [Acidimicrobiales bacterium]|jgi:glycine/D-amino acid oxidase-like deaminating enzyme/nitrite reductase/ring-hydroxylating ferredoxin subunit|nr:FAD-dependent oxidoreductase [Acidimicrobiales bacterium]
MGTLFETNRSVWVATTTDDRLYLPYTTVGDQVPEVDVVVVGGGITGLSTALTLAERGAKVVVLEAGRICSGVTGYTTAKVTSLHGLQYADLAENRGDDVAQLYGEANEAAIAQVAAWVETYRIDCDFQRRDAFTYTTESDKLRQIESEAQTASRLGLPASYTTETDLPYDVFGAVRFANQAQFHPRDYCIGVAAAITQLGGKVHEDTRVLDVDAERGDDPSIVRTEHGDLAARFVVLATHLPFLDRGGFFAKAHPTRSYAMAVRLEEGAPTPKGMYLSKDSSSRSVRSALGDEVLILGGEGHKTGQDPDTRERYSSLESWAREYFPIASIEHRWSAQDYVPVDGTPFVGRQLPGSNVLVATGFQKWGMTNGTAAGRILADIVDGIENPWLAAYDATRIKSTITSKEFVKENVDAVGGHLAGDRLKTMNPPSADTLAPGEGGIVSLDGEKVAAFRAEDGTLTAVSPVCTHMGCLVCWNTAEKSWDCPCHGSRYTCGGKVIQGPALHDLEPHGSGE